MGARTQLISGARRLFAIRPDLVAGYAKPAADLAAGTTCDLDNG
jgi:hypothetical protein